MNDPERQRTDLGWLAECRHCGKVITRLESSHWIDTDGHLVCVQSPSPSVRDAVLHADHARGPGGGAAVIDLYGIGLTREKAIDELRRDPRVTYDDAVMLTALAARFGEIRVMDFASTAMDDLYLQVEGDESGNLFEIRMYAKPDPI